jgi:outer membrane immunogenic protein
MRKLLIAAVAAFAGMSTMAHAADIYEGSLKDEPTAYAPAPVWTGLYIGGHLGGLWNDSGDSSAHYARWNCRKEKCEDWYKSSQTKFDEDDDLSLLGGFHVGYNWQDGARVYGLEGDVSFASGIDYLASLRGRIGHLLNDDLLIYATAGVAFVGFDDKTVDFSPFGGKKNIEIPGDSEVGFVIGGGVERKLTSNISVGLEGLYYLFDDAEFSKTWKYGDWCKKIDHEDDNDLFVVRARLSYSLNRDEPTLDSYK